MTKTPPPVKLRGLISECDFTPGTYWTIPLLTSSHGPKPALPLERWANLYHPQVLQFRSEREARVAWMQLSHAYAVDRMTTERERWEAEQAVFAASCRERFQFALANKIDQSEGELT